MVLVAADLPLEVRLDYEAYPGHSFVRHGATIRNSGSAPITLDEVSLAMLNLGVAQTDLTGLYGLERAKKEGSPYWFNLHTYDGAKDSGLSFETGHWRAATWLTLAKKSNPEGLVLGWETSAITQCTINSVGQLSVLLRPAFRLEPGDSFVVPKAFVGLFEGDLDESHYLTHRFVEEHLAWPNPGDDFPFLMFNSWGYGTAINDLAARNAIDLCSKLGVEVFVADFGWEGPDWEPLPEAFPAGLVPIAGLCRENGMKFGIHLSYANVSEQAQMYKDHPDWVYDEGCWAYGHGAYKVHALSLGLPQVRDWITHKAVEVLDRNQVDWFLTDTHLWGRIDPAKHGVPADQNYLASTGHEAVIDAIHARRPGVLIEHCDGGLSLANYKMMQQHVTSITCDNADALETRLSVYDLSRFLPPRYLDKYQQEWRSHYANRSCMFGGPWILMTPIHTLEPGSRDWNELVADIALYKETRSLIREGKVLHLLAPGDPASADWDGWDAIGSYHPGMDDAVVFVFRTRGGLDARTIPMTSLRPEGRYTVRYVDSGRAYTATGTEIRRDGFALTLDAYVDDPHSYCSEVIRVDAQP